MSSVALRPASPGRHVPLFCPLVRSCGRLGKKRYYILSECDAINVILSQSCPQFGGSCPQFALPRTTECLISFLKALVAAPNERTRDRVGYRAGHYPRSLVTRVGKLELRITGDRDGRFSTELFERFQRSEQALVSALAFARQSDVRTIRKPPAGSCSRHPRRRCAVRCPTPQPVPAPGRRTRGARRIARRGGNVRHRVPRTASRRRAAA